MLGKGLWAWVNEAKYQIVDMMNNGAWAWVNEALKNVAKDGHQMDMITQMMIHGACVNEAKYQIADMLDKGLWAWVNDISDK